MYLVLLETSGNQNFIFSTNKLRENIGASELTYQTGTHWVLEPVRKITKKSLNDLKDLTNSELNPPIETNQIEIIIAASGKALLLTKTADTAKEIIKEVTQKALIEAPGIDICGVYLEFDWNESQSLDKTIKEIYKLFPTIHSKLPTPAYRFQRLPVVAECATSGLPAATLITNPDQEKLPISTVSKAKRNVSEKFLTRIKEMLKKQSFKKPINLPGNLEDLEKVETSDWLGVIHADGNGLGQIFLNFGDYVESNRDYVNKLRQFSLSIDECTQEAFIAALEIFGQSFVPIVPLVLGGDDLTVICDGKYALEFTRKFLEAFEKATANHQDIKEITAKSLPSPGLSACAGVAIIKPNFPFYVAYELAEDLLKSAKKVKNYVNSSCSALDFHIVYDSSGVELKTIRDRLQIPGSKTKLYKRPLVVSSPEKFSEKTQKEWAQFYHWDNLVKKVKVLNISAEDKDNYLPPSQTNQLRSACFQGKDIADAKYQLIRQRYPKISELEEKDKSLFQADCEQKEIVTSFIDALDAKEFILGV